jgi:hypothetical protein
VSEQKKVDLSWLLRVLDLVASVDGHDILWWRTDGEYAPLTLFVNCNDFFYWGTADAEEVTPENTDVLARCVEDVKATGTPYTFYALTLFCCRVRGMRPQTPVWKGLDAAVLPLFLAAGPERDPKDEG